MSENHTHDKELLEQVERLVESGHPSGNRLLDDLAAMKAKAKPTFQHELENRLMASFQAQQTRTKENIEVSTLALKPRIGIRKFTSIPATLAAAIVAVFVMSGILFLGNLPLQNGSVAQSVTFTPTSATTDTNMISSSQLTETAIVIGATVTAEALMPTPPPFLSIPEAGGNLELQAVVIARQDIARGTVLTADMLGLAYYPVDISLNGSYANPSPLVGMVVTNTIAQYQPILTENFTLADGELTSIFEYGGYVTSASTTAADEMTRAGMSWIAVQVRYSAGMDISAAEDAINTAHEQGFHILLNITGDVSDLTAGGEGYITQYAGFLGEVAALSPDAIEVWSEPNIDRSWTTGEISGAAYVEMLREAYQAIKAADSEVMVISAAPTPTGAGDVFPDSVVNDDQWITQVVEAGGLDYMDCLGAHYVEGVVAPYDTSNDPRDDYYTRYFGTMLDTYVNLIDGARPICFTSLGYLTPEGYPSLGSYFAWATNTTVAQQASWLASAAMLSAQSGQVRLMIIWNVDFTDYAGDNPMAGYAIIRPDGCPACNSLGAMSLGSRIIGSEITSSGQVQLTIAHDSATLIWALASEVDVVSSTLFFNAEQSSVQDIEQHEGAFLASQRIAAGVPIDLNDDGSFTLVLSQQDAEIMRWTIEAGIPFMVIPSGANPAEAIAIHVEPLEGNRYSVYVPNEVLTSDITNLQAGNLVDVTITLQFDGSEGRYVIEDAQVLDTDMELIGVVLAVDGAADAGALSWAQQGGFTVTIAVAQP
jgi:hypothetical protein